MADINVDVKKPITGTHHDNDVEIAPGRYVAHETGVAYYMGGENPKPFPLNFYRDGVVVGTVSAEDFDKHCSTGDIVAGP